MQSNLYMEQSRLQTPPDGGSRPPAKTGFSHRDYLSGGDYLEITTRISDKAMRRPS